MSKNNTLCFTRDGTGSKGKDDIFIAKWNDGKYEIPASMSDSINSEGMEFNAYLSWDESYILFTAYDRKGGSGSGDLYISYNKGNDEWTTAINLANINSQQMDYCPFVNQKTGSLYFTSRRTSVQKQFDKRQNAASFLNEKTLVAL